MKRIILLTLLILSAATAYTWDNLQLDLQLEIARLSRASEPDIRRRTVLFTFDEIQSARYVGIAFDFEDYQVVHPFKRNPKGIFVLPFTPPNGTIRYRLVVDGLWMPDPMNPRVARDAMGNTLSELTVSLTPERQKTSPAVLADRTVVFTLSHTPGKRIYVTGDFTDWEPFLIQMTEIEPGRYEFSVRLPPGTYEYCYIAAGARILDPINPNFGTDTHGYLASRFAVH